MQCAYTHRVTVQWIVHNYVKSCTWNIHVKCTGICIIIIMYIIHTQSRYNVQGTHTHSHAHSSAIIIHTCIVYTHTHRVPVTHSLVALSVEPLLILWVKVIVRDLLQSEPWGWMSGWVEYTEQHMNTNTILIRKLIVGIALTKSKQQSFHHTAAIATLHVCVSELDQLHSVYTFLLDLVRLHTQCMVKETRIHVQLYTCNYYMCPPSDCLDNIH